MIISFNDEQMKKILLYKASYFPGRYSHTKDKIKIELDLSNDKT